MIELFKLGDPSCSFTLFYISLKEDEFEPLPKVFEDKIIIDQESKDLVVSNIEKSSQPSVTFYLKGLLSEQYEVSKTFKVIYRKDEDEGGGGYDGGTDGDTNEAPKFIIKTLDPIDIEISYMADIVT